MLRALSIVILMFVSGDDAWAITATDRPIEAGVSRLELSLTTLDKLTLVVDSGLPTKTGLARAFHDRGKAYYKLGWLERAIQDYSRALLLDPADYGAYYNRAKAHADLGEHDLAVEDYSQAIRLMPDHDFAYYSRANSLFVKGDRPRAIEDYRKAYLMNPSDPVYRDKMRELRLLE